MAGCSAAWAWAPALAPPLVAAIVSLYGWQMAFYFSAVIGLVICAVWYFFARDTPAEHPKVTPAGTGAYQGRPAGQDGRPDAAGAVEEDLHQPRHVVVTLAYVAFGYVAFMFHTWFFPYVKDGLRLDMKKSALLSACCPSSP